MKRVLLTAALLLTVSAAHATYCKDGTLIASHPNGDCSKPIPGPVPPTPAPTSTSSNAGATAAAAANSSSASKSASTSQASGGNASAAGGKSDSSANANGSQQLSGIGNDTSQSSFRAYAISLPMLAFTPPQAISGCPTANQEQASTGVGFGLGSRATSSSNSDHCFAINLYNGMLEQCRYESARRFMNAMSTTLYPTFKPADDKYTGAALDLTAKECSDLKAPPPIAPTNVSVSGPDYHIIDRGPACATPAPVAAKSKTKAKAKRVAMITECRVN